MLKTAAHKHAFINIIIFYILFGYNYHLCQLRNLFINCLIY